MTLRKYLDSYLYLEYFHKSNLVLGIFWIFIANPETKSKSHSQVSHPNTKPFFCNNQRYIYWLPVCIHIKFFFFFFFF